MYVLFVARGYPSEKYKMNGIFEFDQAKALNENGYKVIFAAVDVRSIQRTRKWGIEKKNIEGIEVFVMNIPCGRVTKKIRRRIKSWGLKKLYDLIEKEYGKPSIVHAHFIENGFVVAESLSHLKIPLVLTEHYSAMSQRTLSKYYNEMGAATYHRIDKVIAVSEYLADNIKEKFDIDTVVVPNILDLKSFNYKKFNKNNNKEEFTFISVGGLNKIKRMDLLIEAFSSVFKNKPKNKLIIFGEGPERNALQKLIDIYNMGEQIQLKGLVSREVIAEHMGESDCFVLVSESETFGVAYIEALAMGLPVIASKCGGPEGFIDENNGLLLSNDSKEELAMALQFMRLNRTKYESSRISDVVRNEYSSETIAEKLISIYSDIVK